MTEPMTLTYLLLGSAVVTLLTRVLASPSASSLDPKWRARIALLLGMVGGSIAAAMMGKGLVESITAGILVGAGSIGIYELDKGRARPLLAAPAPPQNDNP